MWVRIQSTEKEGIEVVVFPVVYTGFQNPGASHVQSLGLTLCTCEMGAMGDVRRLDKTLSSLIDVERESSWGGAAFVPFPLSPSWARLNTLQAQSRRVLQLSP